jgi:hypothetical protein
VKFVKKEKLVEFALEKNNPQFSEFLCGEKKRCLRDAEETMLTYLLPSLAFFFNIYYLEEKAKDLKKNVQKKWNSILHMEFMYLCILHHFTRFKLFSSTLLPKIFERRFFYKLGGEKKKVPKRLDLYQPCVMGQLRP